MNVDAGSILFQNGATMLFEGTLASSAEGCIASPQDRGRLRKAFVEHYTGIWCFLRRMGVSAHGADDRLATLATELGVAYRSRRR